MPHTLVYFEIPADDPAKLSQFYRELFGWKFENAPAPPGTEYMMINTVEQGGQGVNGGMMKRRDPSQTVTNYFDVPSVEEYTRKVESLGGTVIIAKQAVPAMGWFGVYRDPEGNVFATWQNDAGAA